MKKFDIFLAFVAGACIPGLGQVFLLRYKRAAFFFLGAAACYVLFTPAVGWLFHGGALVDVLLPQGVRGKSKVLQRG